MKNKKEEAENELNEFIISNKRKYSNFEQIVDFLNDELTYMLTERGEIVVNEELFEQEKNKKYFYATRMRSHNGKIILSIADYSDNSGGTRERIVHFSTDINDIINFIKHNQEQENVKAILDSNYCCKRLVDSLDKYEIKDTWFDEVRRKVMENNKKEESISRTKILQEIQRLQSRLEKMQ